MKSIRSMVLLILLYPCSVRAATIIIVIEALVDGKDQLIIHGDTLQWHHLVDHTAAAAVGRHQGRNEPTIITTYLNGGLVMDRSAWTPGWPSPPPNEIRFEAFSTKLTGLAPELLKANTTFSVTSLTNTSLVLNQQPLSSNEFTAIIEFDDPLPSSSIHKARIVVDLPEKPFIRGDATANGKVNITDAVSVLHYLFRGSALNCLDATDYGNNGIIDVSDAIGILGFLFLRGHPPAAPFPSCGNDGEYDNLTCEISPKCG